MATALPTDVRQAYGPFKTVTGGRFAYDSASGTYSMAEIPPNTFVEKVIVFIATVWSGGGAACFGVGHSLATREFFAQVTIATAGAYSSHPRTYGTYFPSANDVTLYYTQDASDTQGVAFFYSEMLYLPDLNVGGIVNTL